MNTPTTGIQSLSEELPEQRRRNQIEKFEKSASSHGGKQHAWEDKWGTAPPAGGAGDGARGAPSDQVGHQVGHQDRHRDRHQVGHQELHLRLGW